MHILTLTTLFPNTLQPHHAVFVRARMEQYVQQYKHRWTVVAPIPYFPRLPFRISPYYDTLARIPVLEQTRTYPVHHPRYLLTPKVGMRHYGRSLTAGVRGLIRRLHAADPFEIIDGHYIFPDGSAAVAIGKELGIPVVLSARGTDLNLYPQLPGIAPLLRANLRDCDHLICVCEGLREEARRLDTPDSRISVIGNGVDATRFCAGDRHQARVRLGLPPSATVLLSVGHLTERKGFDLLIKAAARLQRDDLIVMIVGDGPERTKLEQIAQAENLADRVRFAGAVANDALPVWYQAADLFVLASSREGWPNALCEAQACGLPAVATNVWGIPEIIHHPNLGILVAKRDVVHLHAGLATALEHRWNRSWIEATGRARTWSHVADELETVFLKCIATSNRTDHVAVQST